MNNKTVWSSRLEDDEKRDFEEILKRNKKNNSDFFVLVRDETKYVGDAPKISNNIIKNMQVTHKPSGSVKEYISQNNSCWYKEFEEDLISGYFDQQE